MSYYKSGISGTARQLSSYQTGIQGRVVGFTIPQKKGEVNISGWVATPGVIRDEINQLNTEIATADKEMVYELFLAEDPWGYHVPKPDANPAKLNFYQSVWRPFHTDWMKFRNEHQGVFSNLWGATWDLTQEYRRRFIQVYESGKGVGMVFTGPAPSAPKEGPITAAGKEAWSVLKTGIYILLAISGVYVLLKIIGASPAASKEMTKLIRVGR